MPCYGQWWLGRQCWHLYASGATIETVDDFCYLGSYISTTWNCDQEVNLRIDKAAGVFSKLGKLWNSKKISLPVKTRLYEALVLSTLLNSAELWPVSVIQMKKLEAAHHRWQRRILGISWKDKVTNEKVREATTLPKLEDIIRCRRLRWLGHLSRMDHHRLPRQALTWEPKGFRRRPGRPRQNWKDVIKKDLRKMGISWDEVEEAALRRTGGAGGIVLPNASLTRDEPGTRNVQSCTQHDCLRQRCLLTAATTIIVEAAANITSLSSAIFVTRLWWCQIVLFFVIVWLMNIHISSRSTRATFLFVTKKLNKCSILSHVLSKVSNSTLSLVSTLTRLCQKCLRLCRRSTKSNLTLLTVCTGHEDRLLKSVG